MANGVTSEDESPILGFEHPQQRQIKACGTGEVVERIEYN